MSDGRPTTHDLARVAGVSLATVDRVLNARPGVRHENVKKVLDAIHELGYVRDISAANLALKRFYNLLFILPDSDNEFIHLLEEYALSHAKTQNYERTKINIAKVKAFDPDALVKRLQEIDPDEIDGVAILGPDTDKVRAAIAELTGKNISAVSLVSDISTAKRNHFVGIDNKAAGRTAARLLGRFLDQKDGKILVITGSHLAQDHKDRIEGFREVAARDFPKLDVLTPVEAHDSPEKLAQILPAIFTSQTAIRGIYSCAGGNQELIRFLEGEGLAGKIVTIGHELTPISRQALENRTFDAIISQDAGHLVRSCTRLLRAQINQTPVDADQERIRIDIYLKENMPPDMQGTSDEGSKETQRSE